MSKKSIDVCDGCGKELPRIGDSYKIYLKTDRFWNSVEMDYFEKNLEFCERCANSIKQTLEKIAAKKEAANGTL